MILNWDRGEKVSYKDAVKCHKSPPDHRAPCCPSLCEMCRANSRAAFPHRGIVDILGGIILHQRACPCTVRVEQHCGLPLGARSLPSLVTTKNVCRCYKRTPGRQNCLWLRSTTLEFCAQSFPNTESVREQKYQTGPFMTRHRGARRIQRK